MSKLAKKPVIVPPGVVVTDQNGEIAVKGPKGELLVRVPRAVACAIEEGGVRVSTEGTSKQTRSDLGTTWSLITNAILGVTKGFTKTLDIEGVGYKAALDGETLVLSLGFVNPVRMPIPKGIAVTLEKSAITVTGIDKDAVGQFSADIRANKKPEPYKGKGIRYRGEVVARKAGKKAATAAS